jgi:hypothetical protein
MAMLIGQLSDRKSLRDITDNLKTQHARLYHLGMKPTLRATLARVNEQQPASLCMKGSPFDCWKNAARSRQRTAFSVELIYETSLTAIH